MCASRPLPVEQIGVLNKLVLRTLRIKADVPTCVVLYRRMEGDDVIVIPSTAPLSKVLYFVSEFWSNIRRLFVAVDDVHVQLLSRLALKLLKA